MFATLCVTVCYCALLCATVFCLCYCALLCATVCCLCYCALLCATVCCLCYCALLCVTVRYCVLLCVACVTVRYCVLLCVACVTVCNCAIIRAVPWSLHRQSLLNMLPATLCLGSPQTYCRLFCSATLSHCVCIYRRSETALSNYLQTLQGPRRPSDAEDSSVGVQLFVTHLIPPSWRN